MHARTLVTVGLLVSITLLSGSGVANQATVTATPSTAPNRGTEIGSIISGAIDTALPGISKLATAILAIFKPKPDDPKTTAVNTAVKDTSAALIKSVKDQVKGVEPLATQLDTLGPFLQYGFRASVDLSALMAFMAATPNPTSSQWNSTVRPGWAKVSGALEQIPASTSGVQDPALQQLLLQIIEAKSTTARAIQSHIDHSATVGLIPELSELNSTLATLNVVARIQMRTISDEVHGLVQWSNGLKQGQGGARHLPPEIQEDQATARGILSRATVKR